MFAAGLFAACLPACLPAFLGCAAPVHMTVEGQSDEDLLHLLAHDTGACALVCIWVWVWVCRQEQWAAMAWGGRTIVGGCAGSGGGWQEGQLEAPLPAGAPA